MTPPCEFHNFSNMDDREEVTESFISPKNHKMGGGPVLKDEITIYCSLVFMTFVSWNLSHCDSDVDTL